MPVLSRSRFVRRVLFLILGAASWTLAAQSPAQTPNDQPNPYRTIDNFLQLPQGREWGSSSAIDIDLDGKSIWVAERCGAGSCLTSDLAPVFKIDETGKVVKNFGAGLIVYPHGIHVDRQGNVWVVDGQSNQNTGGRGRGRGRGAAGGAPAATPPPSPPAQAPKG